MNGTRRGRGTAGILAALALFAHGGCGLSRVTSDRTAPVLRAAQASLDGGACDDALAAVSPWLGKPLAPADLARMHFIAGTALFRKADASIGPAEGSRGLPGFLSADEERWLLAAFRHFDDAFWADREGTLAPESLLMAGRVQDFGYLQNFAEALERYRWASRMFPETGAGRAARERTVVLESKFEGTAGTAHGR